MTPQQVQLEAKRLGLRLKPVGDNLAIIPGNRCPPEFAALLRRHKGEILALLVVESGNLPPDCAPWIHVARQVLAGEFDGADRSTTESLTVGLRSVAHPEARKALAQIRSMCGGQ